MQSTIVLRICLPYKLLRLRVNRSVEFKFIALNIKVHNYYIETEFMLWCHTLNVIVSVVLLYIKFNTIIRVNLVSIKITIQDKKNTNYIYNGNRILYAMKLYSRYR